MPRLGGLFSSSASSARSSTQSLPGLAEHLELEDAMKATMYILDDDMEKADMLLRRRDSAFHKLGRSTVAFMKAILGQEHDMMKEASELISEAESAASSEQRHARGSGKGYQSQIYPPGTEYAFVLAQTQIQSAVIGVLNESVKEAVMGFYKIRKAYQALDAIVQAEKSFMNGKSTASLEGSRLGVAIGSHGASTESFEDRRADSSGANYEQRLASQEDSDEDEFFEAHEEYDAAGVPSAYQGNVEHNKKLLNTNDHTRIGAKTKTPERIETPPPQLSRRPQISASEDTLNAADLTNTIDVFIHSGVSLYFGILQLLLSLIPPTFSKILSIVGFRGDRDRGLEMLWQASNYSNINGAVASLVLLGFYSGFVSSLDILPTSGSGAVPWARCHDLLNQLRSRHPNSQLILMQDVRMLTSERQLVRAVEILKGAPPSKLKQIEALQCFEQALNCMYLHQYSACAAGFQRCLTLNNWSKALYTFIAGCAELELYRLYKYGSHFNPSTSYSSPLASITPDAAKAAKHAKQATELLQQAGTLTGKRKIFARQLPFDVFVARKLTKWAARAAAWDVELVDAVGVSPIEEMILFWGGYGRMAEGQLEESLHRLAWSDGADNHWWPFESLDEISAVWLLRATVHRQLGRVKEAKVMLKGEIIDKYRWEEFKALKNADTWPAAVARYELAVCYWLESEEGRKGAAVSGATVVVSGKDGVVKVDPQVNREALKQCSHWLEQVARWESYDLDVRFGTRISTGRETLAKLGVR